MLVALNGYPLAKPVAPLSMTTRNSAVSLAFYERKQGGNATIPSLFGKQAFAHLNFHTAPLASDGHNPIYFVELMQINRCADLAHVRFGSKADMCSAKPHVRFTPNSGHTQCTRRCPLCANSGHRQHHSITSSARPISVFGTLIPSAFAVFRLIISLTLVI